MKREKINNLINIVKNTPPTKKTEERMAPPHAHTQAWKLQELKIAEFGTVIARCLLHSFFFMFSYCSLGTPCRIECKKQYYDDKFYICPPTVLNL
jgi:hypothetical protein